MRVFVTGATGLLGSHLASELRRAGHIVVALCRHGADATFLLENGCELREGDIRDQSDSLAEAMAGCTHVVHGAGLVYAGTEWPKIRAVNVDGTRNVLTAASHAGVQHAVHVSSVAVYGTVHGEIDETASTETDLPPSDLYARSKREGEHAARAVEADLGLPTTVLRPAAVYGERDRLMAPSLADILRLPLVPLFGPADNTLPVVYAGNVATVITAALKAGAGGTTFNVGLDFPLTQRDMFSHLAAGMGLSPRFVRLPASLVRGGVRVLQTLGVVVPGTEHLPLDRVARLALGENPYPSRRIRSELSWTPTHRHAEALARTGRWLAELN